MKPLHSTIKVGVCWIHGFPQLHLKNNLLWWRTHDYGIGMVNWHNVQEEQFTVDQIQLNIDEYVLLPSADGLQNCGFNSR